MDVKKVKLSELNVDPQNTRRHDERNIATIMESLKKFGQYRPFVIQKKGMIIRVGNGMYEAMRRLGWEEGEVEIKDLSDDEATALSIVDNRSSEMATWDEAMLCEAYQKLSQELKNLTGFSEKELNPGDGEGEYSRKIEAPVYEPTGEKPQISDLYDKEKAEKLKAEVLKAKIPEELKQFLLAAAERHVVFDYRNIAEFYAHSEKEVQDLFEKSALVVIDFNRAIEDGFVSLSLQIAELYKKDNEKNDEA